MNTQARTIEAKCPKCGARATGKLRESARGGAEKQMRCSSAKCAHEWTVRRLRE